MRLRSLEPTPNPNNMKLNLEESLPPGIKYTYTSESPQIDAYPPAIRRLLRVPGVKSIFHSLDFLALQRLPSAEWRSILSQAREILTGDAEAPEDGRQHRAAAGFLALPGNPEPSQPSPGRSLPPRSDSTAEAGVKIWIQFFRRIPLLVKVQAPGAIAADGAPGPVEEYRANLPPRFAAAVKAATPASPNMLLERRWTPAEPRYGELKEVGDAVAAEIDAAYPEGRLEALVKQAFKEGAEKPETVETRRHYTREERDALLASGDWKQRFAAVESLGPDREHFNALAAAMQDPHPSVRRQATIYLGLLKIPEALEPLVAALKDPAPVVRRTAGDALNDLADKRAVPAMIEALDDRNKLVRWRAARFLYELGDATALPALKSAADAPEFEVKLQALQAIERIEGGKEAAGPIWMQMTKKDGPGARGSAA